MLWSNLSVVARRVGAFSKHNVYRFISYQSQPLHCNAKQFPINRKSYCFQIYRTTSFFNTLPAEHLWKGVTGVSNAGKKRGRGKGIGKKSAKDLNKGQVIGVGKKNILWPGLNAPIVRGRELVQQQQLPEDPEREKKLIEIRDKMGVFRPLRLSPLERGWSGSKMPGRSIGPPDPVGQDTFDGFDTKVLEFKLVVNMSGTFGRRRRVSSLVVTGNGNGLVGFASGKANEGRASLHTARNRAGQKLVYIKLYKNHTVFHDFFCQFGKTKIFVRKMPEGYGLVCHRAIKAICEVAGIKDLHAKVEGPTNLGHIVKAFFIGLVQQKTHQELAEQKKLNLVELRKENDFFPEVVACPSKCRTRAEVPSSEILDFAQYCLNGRIVLRKKKFPRFYTKLPSWQTHLQRQESVRNHDKVRLHLLSEYGAIRSFMYDKYPECAAVPPGLKEKPADDSSES